MSTFRIEAEDMSLTGYRHETRSFASGGACISLAGGNLAEAGTASFNFLGPSGYYDVVVGYFDESDGVSHVELHNQSTLINAWDFDQNLGSTAANAQTLTSKTIATDLVVNQGETFQLQGQENNGEPARIDYIDFIPVTSGTTAGVRLVGDANDNTINGFGGNDTLVGGAGDDRLNGGGGIDTADYSQAQKGIIANLRTGIVLSPIFGTSNRPRIMPLGDSITAGRHAVSPTPGSYRIQLSADFSNDGLSLNFVGSQSNGPASLADKDHEGHGGWTIHQIRSLVDTGLLNTYQPDIVLLMIGTNDALGAGGNTLSGMRADLSRLIDHITQQSPHTQLFVSSIAPINPSIKGQAKADRAKDFDKLIPGLVSDKAAQGKKVAFVNAEGSLTVNDLVADGVHPKAEGYNKIGNVWYHALVERDTLTGIENITGTGFNDKLVGNSGANVFQGNAGFDTLTGGGGADTFVYRAPTDGKDTITDFSANDILKISASGFGGGLVAELGLSTIASATGVFVSSATPVSIGTSANFLYNTDTGVLQFDKDGTGPDAASTVAVLTGSPALGINQFTIVS